MNNIVISGNLTRNAEVSAAGTGTFLNFTIANNDESRKVGDQWEHITSFFDCSYFSKNPQQWIQQLTKGSPIVVMGQLKQDTWEKDGQKQSRVKITVRGFPMMIARRGETTQGPANNTPPAAASAVMGTPPTATQVDVDKDIPF